MLLITIVFSLIVTVTANYENFTIPVSFRPIGHLATGLAYAHLHTTFNFNLLTSAHLKMEQFISHRQATSNSTEERKLQQLIKIQLQPATMTLKRLETALFNNNRQKRQALFGMSLGFGILGIGMSIYNTVQIQKIHNDINSLHSGFQHIYDVIEEQDQAITTLTQSIKDIKDACQVILSLHAMEEKQISTNTNLIILSTMVSTYVSEVASWGSGLEALMFGHLYPTLVNPKRLQTAMQTIKDKANSKGLTPLHCEVSSIYKSAISYFTTEEHRIVIIIHIPMVEANQIQLFEHLPVPFKIDNLIYTIESSNQILATDKTGHSGTELTKTDLLHCQTEKTHNGNTFICPNTNLLQTNIKNSCLGTLFFGIPHQLHRCNHLVQNTIETEDFIQQIGSNTIILLAKKESAIMKSCPNGTKLLTTKGLLTLTVDQDCSIITDTHIFKPQVKLDFQSDFIERQISIIYSDLVGNYGIKELDLAYSELQKTESPKRRHLAELKKWIAESSDLTYHTTIGYGISIFAITISATIFSILLYLYCKHKRSKAGSN